MGIGWLVVTLSILVILVIFFQSVRRIRERNELRKRYQKKTQSREEISYNDFAQKYFPEYTPSIVCKILESIQKWSIVSMDRLHPSDHLIEDLSISKWDGLEQISLVAEISDACKVKIDFHFLESCSGELGDFIERCYNEISSNP